jgi:hypothetical protein
MPQLDRALKAKSQRNQPGRGPGESLIETAAPPEYRELLKLQRQAGNAAVTEMLEREIAAPPNPEEEVQAPQAGSSLFGMGDVGKLIGESGVVGSGSAKSRPLASASGSVDGGAGPNLGEVPVEAGSRGAGGTSGGSGGGLGNIPKMLEGAGVLSGPKLPGPAEGTGPAGKADPRSAALAASAAQFIQNAVALGVPGIAELAVQIRAALAKQGS